MQEGSILVGFSVEPSSGGKDLREFTDDITEKVKAVTRSIFLCNWSQRRFSPFSKPLQLYLSEKTAIKPNCLGHRLTRWL